LMIYVWNKLVAWPDQNTEADDMYYDYVVKRYQAFPNILWDISKEAMAHGRANGAYILERMERLRGADSYKRLATVHDYGFCKKNEEAVDFISRQDWAYRLYRDMLMDSEAYKDKPVFNIEHGGYEESPYEVFTGAYIDPEVCLRRNYQCAFAGVYSTYYWQAASWDVIIHNPFEQPDDFIKPRFEYFKHMSDFFTSFPFSDYKPFTGRNTSGYCMTGKDGDMIFYIPKGTYKLAGGWMFNDNPERSCQWFNTLTGEYSPLTEVDKKTELKSPWYKQADAILILSN
jgi:hypothetical protein